jgi:hypothetical protein
MSFSWRSSEIHRTKGSEKCIEALSDECGEHQAAKLGSTDIQLRESTHEVLIFLVSPDDNPHPLLSVNTQMNKLYM